MSEEMTIVIDGRVVDAASATISVLDRGLLYGDGVFEVLRTWNGRAVDLDAHLDRIEESARFLRLPMDRARLVDAVDIALQRANVASARTNLDTQDRDKLDAAGVDQRIRIVVTRGPGGLAVPMGNAGPGRTIIIAEPVGALPEEMSLAVVDWSLPRRAGRGHKTLAYLDHVIAREMAREVGADDAVRLDAEGRVAEGGTCNVFAVRDGIVVACDREDDGEGRGGVLPGVTAARVRAICRRSDIPVRVESLTLDEFLAADELFTTSSVKGVVAVTRVVADPTDAERMLPVGVLTRRIRAAYVGDMTAS